MGDEKILQQLIKSGWKVNRTEYLGRVDRALSQIITWWSRSWLSELISQGAVQVDGKVIRKPSQRLKMGEVLRVDKEKMDLLEKSLKKEKKITDFGKSGDKSVVEPEDIPIDVVYEDDDLIVVDKPSGMVVHPAYGIKSGTLANAVAGYFKKKNLAIPQRIGLVHRLDKEVSGLMIIAKNQLAVSYLSRQFSSTGIKALREDILATETGEKGGGDEKQESRWLKLKAHKFYWAVVKVPKRKTIASRRLEDGETVCIEGYIRRSLKNRIKMEFKLNGDFVDSPSGRYCLSYARLIKAIKGDRWLLEVQIITGRTHQIRAQLSALGIPVECDGLYGADKCDHREGIRLRCVKISYIPPGVYKSLVGKGNSVGVLRNMSEKGKSDKNSAMRLGERKKKAQLKGSLKGKFSVRGARMVVKREILP